MKNNKLFKIMIGLVSAIVVVGVVYFGVSYFNGEDNQILIKKAKEISNNQVHNLSNHRITMLRM